MREWLYEIRKKNNLTQCKVSTKANISISYYSQIENGKRNVSVDVAKRIAKVLRFNWSKFYK